MFAEMTPEKMWAIVVGMLVFIVVVAAVVVWFSRRG